MKSLTNLKWSVNAKIVKNTVTQNHAYISHCVRCGNDHHSSAWQNVFQDPLICDLCSCNPLANYKSCLVNKDLHHCQKPNSNNHSISVNFKSSNIRDSHPLNTISSNQLLIQSQTYAQATIGQFSHHKSPPHTPSINLQLSNFQKRI